MRKTFMYVIVTASALFCGLNLYDSFQQARAKEAFFQSRSDDKCTLTAHGKCKNNDCEEQSTDDKKMACATWLDPTNIDYCTCREKPSTVN